MTAYDDIPTINMLYAESELVNQAIVMLDAGATLTNFTVGPPRVVLDPQGAVVAPAGWPNTMWPTARTGETPSEVPMMPVNITVPGAVSPQLLIDLRAWLVTRETEITAELAALGVTATPPVGTMSARTRTPYGAPPWVRGPGIAPDLPTNNPAPVWPSPPAGLPPEETRQ